jgi:hypothetical protein
MPSYAHYPYNIFFRYGTGTGVLGGPVFFFYNRYTKYSKYPTYLPNAHEINLV